MSEENKRRAEESANDLDTGEQKARDAAERAANAPKQAKKLYNDGKKAAEAGKDAAKATGKFLKAFHHSDKKGKGLMLKNAGKGLLKILKDGIKGLIRALLTNIVGLLVTAVLIIIALCICVCILMPITMISDQSALEEPDSEAEHYADLMNRIVNVIGEESFAESVDEEYKAIDVNNLINYGSLRDRNGNTVTNASNSRKPSIQYDVSKLDGLSYDESGIIDEIEYNDEAGDTSEFSYLSANDRIAIQYIATNDVIELEHIEDSSGIADATKNVLWDFITNDFALEMQVAIDALKEGMKTHLTSFESHLYIDRVTVDQDPSEVEGCEALNKVTKIEDNGSDKHHLDPTDEQCHPNEKLTGTVYIKGTAVSKIDIDRIEFRQKEIKKIVEKRIAKKYGYDKNACDTLENQYNEYLISTQGKTTENNGKISWQQQQYTDCVDNNKALYNQIISEHQDEIHAGIDEINEKISDMYTNIANEVNMLAEEGYSIHYSSMAYGAFDGNEEIVYEYLASQGLSDYAIAGIMGNMMQESGINPENVENGRGYEDSDYTNKVNSGAISKHSFITDTIGYGLVQFTSSKNKEYCYDYTVGKGLSIGDTTGQLDALFAYIRKYNSNLISQMNSAKSVYEATLIWFAGYEYCMPKENILANYKSNLDTRANYANQIYDQIQAAKTEGLYDCGDADGTTYFPYADGTYNSGFTGSTVRALFNQTTAEGAGSYSFYGGYMQCVDVSRYIIWKKWHVASVRGNGNTVVSNMVAAYGNKFISTTTPTAGAIFSCNNSYSSAGHTGYISKIENNTVWIVDGWGADGSLHLNRKESLQAFLSEGSNYQFLVPKNQGSSVPNNKITRNAIKNANQIANDNTNIYVSGGYADHKYDCSGFVVACYRQAGVGLPGDHSLYTGNMYKLEQYGFKNVTSEVNFTTQQGMKSGDIIVSPGHAAMYLGNGKMVDAQQHYSTHPADDISVRSYQYDASNAKGWNMNWVSCYRFVGK